MLVVVVVVELVEDDDQRHWDDRSTKTTSGGGPEKATPPEPKPIAAGAVHTIAGGVDAIAVFLCHRGRPPPEPPPAT